MPERRLGEALTEATERLRLAGSETPRLDAEVLLADVLRLDRATVLAHPEAPLGPGLHAAFGEAVARGERGEPVAYIRGIKEFYSLAFSVDARALIPRPETELLVDLGISRAVAVLTGPSWRQAKGRLRVIDVGTGCGAVAIAFYSTLRRRGYERVLDVLGTDSSGGAVELARENAVAHGLADAIRFREADLLPGEEPSFDIVLANLPYVPSAEIADLPVAVTFEPRAAIDGGSDGLAVIRRLIDRLEAATTDLAVALLEIGPELREGIERLASERLPSWSVAFHRDLAGEFRVTELRRDGE